MERGVPARSCQLILPLLVVLELGAPAAAHAQIPLVSEIFKGIEDISLNFMVLQRPTQRSRWTENAIGFALEAALIRAPAGSHGPGGADADADKPYFEIGLAYSLISRLRTTAYDSLELRGAVEELPLLNVYLVAPSVGPTSWYVGLRGGYARLHDLRGYASVSDTAYSSPRHTAHGASGSAIIFGATAGLAISINEHLAIFGQLQYTDRSFGAVHWGEAGRMIPEYLPRALSLHTQALAVGLQFTLDPHQGDDGATGSCSGRGPRCYRRARLHEQWATEPRYRSGKTPVAAKRERTRDKKRC